MIEYGSPVFVSWAYLQFNYFVTIYYCSLVFSCDCIHWKLILCVPSSTSWTLWCDRPSVAGSGWNNNVPTFKLLTALLSEALILLKHCVAHDAVPVGKLDSSVSRLVLEPSSPQNISVWLPSYPLVQCHFPEKNRFLKTVVALHYGRIELSMQSLPEKFINMLSAAELVICNPLGNWQLTWD